MTTSSRVRYQWNCPSCGKGESSPVWRILDERERPDVIQQQQIGLAHVICSACGTPEWIQAPLLLIRPSSTLPVLLAGSLVDLQEENLEWGQLWHDFVLSSTTSTPSFGQAIPLPRFLLPLVLRRDSEADIRNIESVLREMASTNSEQAEWYAQFLVGVSNSAIERDTAVVLHDLWGVHPDDLVAYLNTHPLATSDLAVTIARRELAAGPPEGDSDEPLQARLVLFDSLNRGASIEECVAEYRRRFGAFGLTVINDVNEIMTRLNGDMSDAALPAARRLLLMAVSMADPELERQAASALAARLLQNHPGDGPMVEEAIRLLERVDDLSTTHDSEWVRTRGHLGAAYTQRTSGDPGQNWQKAIDVLEEATSVADRGEDARTWAMIHTNFGLALASRPGGSSPDELSRAITHLLLSLEEKNEMREPLDWCYTQINLGLTFTRRGQVGDSERARALYEAALPYLNPLENGDLWGTVQCNLANNLFYRDDPDLDRAEQIVEHVTSQFGRSHGVQRGRAFSLWADIADKRAGSKTRIGADYRQSALALLDLRSVPDEYLTIGGSLVDYLQSAKHWTEAGEVYSRLIQAFDVLYDVQFTAEGRARVIAAHPRLHRWAAYVFARIGLPQRAIEVAEQGRARQLSITVSRASIDLRRLQSLDTSMAEQYDDAIRSYRNMLQPVNPTGQQISEPGIESAILAEESIQRIIGQIRLIPEFENFLMPMSVEQICDVGLGSPIIYLVAAPYGCYVLTAKRDTDGSIYVDSESVEGITSTSIAGIVLGDLETGEVGLLGAQTNGMPEDALEGALTRAFCHLSPIASVIAEQGRDSDTVILVPTGLLGLVPLHALPLTSSKDAVLDEVVEVHLAPSAAVYSASCHRSARQVQQNLVAIADTDPAHPLPGSLAEVIEIATLFPSGGASIRTGAAASLEWVLDNAAKASHLHLACHGASDISDPDGGRIVLGGGSRLSTRELANRQRLNARVTVASACQTGIYATGASPDEFVGLASGLLQAGAACAIVSLWPVLDETTPLLMSRFYEYLNLSLPAAEQRPVTALRAARLWLRTLTSAELQLYISARPALAHTLRAAGLPVNRGSDATKSNRPFASPECWAPFIAYGF